MGRFTLPKGHGDLFSKTKRCAREPACPVCGASRSA